MKQSQARNFLSYVLSVMVIAHREMTDETAPRWQAWKPGTLNYKCIIL